MKIVYLENAAKDIAWFRHYYSAVFPEGASKARAHLKSIQQLLAENPYIGHRSDSHARALEFHIRNTPFSLIYRVTSEQIEILRLWDERQGSIF
jgi:toxin ParE1/3/4